MGSEGDDSDEEKPPITQDNINYARLCNALLSVCTDALRQVLLSHVPTGFDNIYQAIKAKKKDLIAINDFKKDQRALVFPDRLNRYTGTVDQFDIALLYLLIRNVSSVPPHVRKWGRCPCDNPRDISLGASAERIRLCRNKTSGHSKDGKLNDQSFETYWKEIAEALDDIENAIGDKGFRGDLERRKKQVITPKEAHLLKKQFKIYQLQLQGLYYTNISCDFGSVVLTWVIV